MPEILSPCGSMESFYAAIEAGCDAVYLAGKMFGARGFANNFTDEELVYVINYAHLYGVKVYVTCNILILEIEVTKFLNYVDFLHKNNVDALIMQDLGMIDLVHKTYPNLEIHGSTQMHIHNLDGAMVAKSMGIKRIVLARETPLEVIKEIKEKTGLEIEIFVHGALCVSYSGMCLFARSIGPRSGNRGTCTGCCRLPYKLENNKQEMINSGNYPLSMKDLMTINYLDKLIDLGVNSFKIEGRMKSPSYVYTTTKLYRETRDNYLKTKKIMVNQEDLYNLQNIFSRPTTKGYILNEDNKEVINPDSSNHQGVLIGKVTKTKNNYVEVTLTDDVSIHDGLRIINKDFEYGLTLNEFTINNKQVYTGLKKQVITFKVNKNIPLNSKVYRTLSYKIETEIKNKINQKLRKIPITFKFIALKDKNIILTVTDYQNTITIEGNIPLISLNKETTKLEIQEKLAKVGDTIYQIDNIMIEKDNNLFIPISEINHLRRDILNKLNELRILNFKKDYLKKEYIINVPDFNEENSYSYLGNIKSNKYKYFYSETDSNKILKLPKVIDNYNKYDPKKEYLVGELGALNSLSNIITDYSFNVTNSYTVAFLHSRGVKRVTLSLELNDKDIEDLVNSYLNRYYKRPNLELIIKSRWELMVTKFNFNNYYNNIAYLIDRFHNKYLIKVKNNLTYIYDYKITSLDNPSKYFKLGINCLREEEDEV